MSDVNDNKYTNVGAGLAICAGIGTATQNIGVWMLLGTGFGVAIGAALSAAKSSQDQD